MATIKKVGDKIRVTQYFWGYESGTKDYIIEEFRQCLGIFESEEDRIAGNFKPLCELYEPGPNSEEKYIPNYGTYRTDMVQGWMDLTNK